MAIKFLNTVAVDTDILYVDTSNDRVGIGTDSPQAKLDVDGDTFLASRTLKITGGSSTTSFVAARHDSSGTEGLLNKLSFKSVGTYFDNNFISITDTSVALPLDTSIVQEAISSGDNSWNVLTLPKNSGTFALENWVTSNFAPSTGGDYLPLTGGTIDGQILISNTFPALDFVDTNSFTDPNDRFRVRAGGNQGLMQWYDDSSSSLLTLMTLNPNGDVIVPNGDVGIGTSSPVSRLHTIGEIVGGTTGFTSGMNGFTGLGSYDSSTAVENIDSLYLRKGGTNGSSTSIAFGSAGGDDYFVGSRIKHIRSGSNSKGHLAFETKGDTSTNTTSERMRITDEGNVSIGDVSGAKLSISGSVGTTNGTAALPTHSFYSDLDTGMFRAAVNTLAFSTGASERMRITSGGELIINGTTSTYGVSQGYPLHVKGTSSQGYVSICRGTQNSGSEGLIVGTDSSNAYLLSRDNISLILGTNNLSHVFIKPNGNVGIGTTSPNRSLVIQTNESSYGSMRIYRNSETLGETSIGFFGTATQAQNQSWVIGEGGWGNSGDFVIGNENGGAGGNVRLLVQRDGNVGIGTTSPSARLHVSGGDVRLDDGQEVRFDINGTVTAGEELIIDAGGTDSKIVLDGADSAMQFITGNSVAIKIDDAQRVGVGTTSPSQLLHVAGNMRLQNQLYDSTNSLGSNGEVLTKVSAGTEWKAPAFNAQIPDNTAPASPANVGTIRYRSTSNTSFVDMSMQTGATTYTWVNIVSNFW